MKAKKKNLEAKKRRMSEGDIVVPVQMHSSKESKHAKNKENKRRVILTFNNCF